MNRRTLLGAALLSSVPALSRATPALGSAPTALLRAADVHPGTYPTVLAQKWLAEQLKRQSAGALQLKIYHSGQLGRESDTVDLVRLGALDCTRVFAAGLNNAVTETAILGLPFLFQSVAHQRRVLDGQIGQAVLDSLEAYQLKGLAIYDAGARHFYAKRELRHPDDLKGLKIRVPVSDLFIDLLRTLGANPTPLAYGSVYSALETGLIDGAENNLRSFHVSGHFETVQDLSLSAHSYAPDFLVMSLPRWQQMGQSEQALLQTLARQSVNVMREAWDSGEQQALSALETAQVRLHAVDTSAYAERCKDLHQRYLRTSDLQALYQHIKQAS